MDNWGGLAGLTTPEAWGVLVTRSGGGHLLALPRGVLGGRILLYCCYWGCLYMSERDGICQTF